MKQVRKFNAKITDDAGMCHRLTRRGYGIAAGGPKGEPLGSAWAAWEFSSMKHKDRNFPTNVAVPLWFSHYGSYGSPAKHGNWGHVAVRLPGTKTVIVSSPGSGHGQKRFSSIEALEQYFNAKYVGWTEDVNGRQVIKKDPNKPVETESQRLQRLAQEVWDGLHGNGEVRKKALGKDYAKVQALVNKGKPASAKSHTVKAGENLSVIAKKYGTTWQAIYAKNKTQIGSNPNVIRPGQKLTI